MMQLGWLGLAVLLACVRTSAPEPAGVGAGAEGSTAPRAMPGPVEPVAVVEREGGGWQVTRGGAPFEVRGVGYKGELDALVAAGGNTLRTWGVGEETRALLDEAHEQGVVVVLGLWLGHVEHGFDYGDEAALAQQLAEVRQSVLRYREHPALLMWGVGNEVELEGGDDPRIWAHIEEAAAAVKALDPHHPTVAVTAEIGEAHEARLSEHCPSIDVWGINSYGGAPSLPGRLDARGFTGPWMLTEFGGPGDWEVPKTAWGAPHEPTSTAKAEAYRVAYDAAVADPRNVGTFAFLWGPAEFALDTWFPMFGPGGAPLEAAGAMQQRWAGTSPADRAPRITALETEQGGAVVAPGDAIEARLVAEDPEGEALRYAWVLHRDSKATPVIGGSPGAPVRCEEGTEGTIAWAAPTDPGAYRLLGVAEDPAGGIATAELRFHVGPPEAEPKHVGLPLDVEAAFQPSGWMGDAPAGAVAMGACAPRPGFCQGVCRRFEVTGGNQGWSGVVWQHPPNNWNGRRKGRRIRPGATHVVFTAWSDEDRVAVTFGAGGEVDGFSVSRTIMLTTEPTEYRLELRGKRYGDVTQGFSWVAGPREVAFQVADVRWVGD